MYDTLNTWETLNTGPTDHHLSWELANELQRHNRMSSARRRLEHLQEVFDMLEDTRLD